MTLIAFVTAGPIEQITGGYLYDRRIVEGLNAQGRVVSTIPLIGRHPDPDAESLADAAGQLGRLGPNAVLVIDGLAAPACLDILGTRPDLRAILLAHHPLGVETGLEPALARRLQDLECRVVGLARGAICPSPASAEAVVGMGMPANKVHVVPPGLDPAVHPAKPRPAGPVRLLALGTVIPRKGHILLVEALAPLVDLDWQLTIIGSLDRDPATATALAQAIEALALSDRIVLAGEHPPEALSEAYRAADIFVLPSFHEGYGMVYTEAMAHGLPIVATTAGAIPETVPRTAGLLVPPGDAGALTAAVRRLIGDSTLRRDLGRAGAVHARTLPKWSARAMDFGRAIDTILKTC